MIEIFSNDEAAALARLVAMGWREPKAALTNLRLLAKGPFAPHIDSLAALAAASPSPGDCLNNVERLSQTIPPEVITASLRDETVINRLIAVAGSSPALVATIIRNPGYYEWLFMNNGLSERRDPAAFRSGIEAAMSGVVTFDEAARALRVYRQKEYLRIGSRDILDMATLEETVTELSDLASVALDAALGFIMRTLKLAHGAPLYIDDDGVEQEAAMTVIGLGKLGGRELNFSSDIDIIFIYASDNGETTGVDNKAHTRLGLHAFFVKAASMTTRLISRITDEGFVFRVDLNLRPDGKGGQAAISLRGAEIYYESWGQPWERAAMLKARPVAGDAALGSQFIETVRPFVFRRFLDFTAIEEIKVMKERIDLSLLRRSPDTVDVKLGEGGIREVEFFCQALQLIHSGRDRTLRHRSTLHALAALEAAGLVKATEAANLRDGYVFLRRLEHRIQIVEGAQSQTIPALPDELLRLARMMGFRDEHAVDAGAALWEAYKRATGLIHDIYRSLFYSEEDLDAGIPDEIRMLLAPDLAEGEAATRLGQAGFKELEATAACLFRLRGASQTLRLGARSIVLLARLMPVFIHRAACSPEPDKALAFLERLIFSIGPRPTFYSLLAENPAVIDELMKIFGTSVFLSRRLIERPESLDMLLSKDSSVPYRRKGEFLAGLDVNADYEEALEELRRLKNQEVFRIGVNDVRGNLTGREITVQITLLAEAALNAALGIAETALRPVYGAPLSGWFTILGLGKLGSRELIYGSDLDIVFVYGETGDECRTDGPKPIGCHEYFVKLAQRIISILTLRTREGFVFDVDARLRPSGSSGPLVVSCDALLSYHASKTSVWERQAWLKARAVAGDIAAGSAVLMELAEVVYSRPLTAGDVDEMLRIRARMEEEIAKETNDRYNLKAGRGGLNDIEFLTQALQLFAGNHDKSLRIGQTRKALKRLFAAGMLEEGDYHLLTEAHAFYRRIELRQRIVADRPEGILVAGSEELTALAKRADYKGKDPGAGLLDDYVHYATAVRIIFNKVLTALREHG
ncbi:MAG: bifunctional [glutamate--ammonia ligase]-adenylyl-L-tyrosine phosphorylase/[glutamate--ammonia-ligase] adenylyltransferase [Deltaproteobacteria bacterium]|nr:bifunctional [glutamate--ammonia ligase]-adenylyl-L-tyrosine phosphorylase/[glutamate--ammonia-ligase] adenylyltransferase [Deltaproteobacteria bacterium]